MAMKTQLSSTSHDDTLRAYAGLRQLLVLDQLPPGKRLPEVEWSNRLQTSRPAIREALALLAHEELLVRGERGGFFVAEYTQEDLAKIFQARIVVETGAVRLMVGRELDQKLLDRMGEYCKTMEYLLNHEIWLGFCEIDRKFHMTLVELAGNEWLVRMHRRTPAGQFVFPEADSATIKQVGLDVTRAHREIHQAICERRTEDAVVALEKHLTLDPSHQHRFRKRQKSKRKR